MKHLFASTQTRDGVENLIHFALSNFTLTFLMIGLIASSIALLRVPKPLIVRVIVEALFAYFLFSVGFSFFYDFVMHTFFGEMTARFTGWPDRPFQAEVGFASLGAVAGEIDKFDGYLCRHTLLKRWHFKFPSRGSRTLRGGTWPSLDSAKLPGCPRQYRRAL